MDSPFERAGMTDKTRAGSENQHAAGGALYEIQDRRGIQAQPQNTQRERRQNRDSGAARCSDLSSAPGG
jgi:hypothetical protein